MVCDRNVLTFAVVAAQPRWPPRLMMFKIVTDFLVRYPDLDKDLRETDKVGFF